MNTSVSRNPLLLFAIGIMATVAVLASACSSKASGDVGSESEIIRILTDSISLIAAEAPGEIGVALIIDDTDTVTVNNRSIYPMMSVFKLHQALAVCHFLDAADISLDSILAIERVELDAGTWSPMMKDYSAPKFSLSIGELLRYALIQSDNNASNLMFERLTDTEATDGFTATLIPRESFRIAHTEAEMDEDHSKAYANRTSPLGAAILINRLFTESLVSHDKQEFIKVALSECATGKDRISGPLADKKGVTIAHKTGSGYTDGEGILAAHNDVAFITLPDGRHYSLAVFVKDLKGNEADASRYISRISKAVYSQLASRAEQLR